MSATFTDVSFRQYTNHHMCYRSSKLHYEKSMLQIDRQSDSETFDRTNIISNKVHSASKHTITNNIPAKTICSSFLRACCFEQNFLSTAKRNRNKNNIVFQMEFFILGNSLRGFIWGTKNKDVTLDISQTSDLRENTTTR